MIVVLRFIYCFLFIFFIFFEKTVRLDEQCYGLGLKVYNTVWRRRERGTEMNVAIDHVTGKHPNAVLCRSVIEILYRVPTRTAGTYDIITYFIVVRRAYAVYTDTKQPGYGTHCVDERYR